MAGGLGPPKRSRPPAFVHVDVQGLEVGLDFGIIQNKPQRRSVVWRVVDRGELGGELFTPPGRRKLVGAFNSLETCET